MSGNADLVLKTLRTRTARLISEMGSSLPQLLMQKEVKLLNMDHSFDEMGFEDVGSAFENGVSRITEVEEVDDSQLETPDIPKKILEHRSSIADSSLAELQESPDYGRNYHISSSERRNLDTAHFGTGGVVASDKNDNGLKLAAVLEESIENEDRVQEEESKLLQSLEKKIAETEMTNKSIEQKNIVLSEVGFPFKENEEPSSIQLSRIDPDDTNFLNQLDMEIKRTEQNV